MFPELRSRIAQLGLLGPIALFMVLGPATGAVVLAATGKLWLAGFLGLGVWKIPVFLSLTAVLAGLSLVPTHAASLLGGMAFGAFGGIGLALVGIALAAWLGFSLLRKLCRARALSILSQRPQLEAIHRELTAGHMLRSIGLLALIRLSPAMPFSATNLLMSTTGIGLVPFLAGSVLGMSPRVVAVAWIGSTLTELDWSQASDRRLFYLGVVATIAVLWVLRGIAKRALSQMTREA
ncbi:MAG: TVP38/TMEM64 family protein [Planctomycetes bacterium]|nr:TVP38/TMEM64 family protein [Planctomycetota bacterium]